MQALACFEGELGEGCAEQERHDRVGEKEDAERLHAGDEMGGGAFVREEEADEDGDAADRDVGATEVGGVVVEGVGVFAEVAQERGENGEGADETEELEPLPLGEEPVVAGVFGGDDGRGFVGREGLERGGESEGGEGEDGPGEMSLTEAGEAEDKDEGKGVGGHQGMEERGEDEAEGGGEKRAEGAAVVECEGYG